MSTNGIDYVYFETRDFARARAFWEALGFELTLDLGNAGTLTPPDGGAGIFLEQVTPETPLADGLYLKAVAGALRLAPEVEKVGEQFETHWGSKLQRVRDPDGREFLIQYTPD
jgi:catechol 2,3-dioxygenase-like lactoylglutathione lyase family enzyme